MSTPLYKAAARMQARMPIRESVAKILAGRPTRAIYDGVEFRPVEFGDARYEDAPYEFALEMKDRGYRIPAMITDPFRA